jgi:transglutaminase-like putative cysteine protease
MPRFDVNAAVSVERFFQFSLLGLVASGYLAVAGSGYLDVPTIALTAAGLLLRGLLICGVFQRDISERTVTTATLAYILFFAVDYFLLSRDLLAATVHLVFFLAVVKILTAITNRDYLYTAVIAFLELLAAAILSTAFNFFLCLALFLLFAIAALTSNEIRRSMHTARATARGGLKRFHPRLAFLSTFITFGILVLTAGLFFLLPRTADAAFSHLFSNRIHLAGFSNRVTLGEIGEIQASSHPVMHIRIFSRDMPGGLKWRGGALTDFDGRRWSNPKPQRKPILAEHGRIALVPPTQRRLGRHVTFDVELADLDTDALFFAGSPEWLDIRQPAVWQTETDSFRMSRPPPSGFRYEAYSLLEDPPEASLVQSPEPSLALRERSRYLELPRLDARVPQLARSVATGAVSDLEKARAVEHHLRTEYTYTLQLPDHEVPDPLAYFLFVRRKGHCEYFASAMAVMLRSLGIPTRLATGFQTGIYNPLTELWVVRSSDAHTWVEAWMPGRGWTSFDPTPPDLAARSFTLSTRLSLYLDAASTFWQEWVVSYDPSRQGTLADRLEQSAGRLGIRWFDSLSGVPATWDVYVTSWLKRYGLKTLAALLAGAGIWLFAPRIFRQLYMRRRVRKVRRGEASVGDATLLYQRMLHIVKRHGYHKPAWFTPGEFAASLQDSSLAIPVADFTKAYNALRFGGRTEAAPLLSLLLDELEECERKSAK